MNIRPYQAELETTWDNYVRERPGATLFHLTAWMRAIQRAFGFEPRYLLAEAQGRICGVLPLFLTSTWVQGRTLISTPFAVYGGICADSPEARGELREAARKLAVEGGVEYLELREQYAHATDGFQNKDLYVTFDRELRPDPEALLRCLPRKTRYMIRKGQKNGLRAVWGNDQLDSFYEIYAQSVQALGTPVFAKGFFQILREEFGEAAETTVVWHGNTAVAAVLSFRFRDAILPYYGGSIPEARQLGASNFMYWEVLKHACERGLRTFDFGRSKRGSGSYFFKTQWNMQERPLPYQYYLVRRRSMPNFSPANPRFQLAIHLWKRLPFPVTKVLGPALVRLFP